MTEIVTDREVNASQLTYELGGCSLRVVGPYAADDPDVPEDLAGKTVVRTDDCDEGTLAAAIDSHEPEPEWIDPEYVPPPTVRTVEEKVLAALDEAKDFASFSAALKSLLTPVEG